MTTEQKLLELIKQQQAEIALAKEEHERDQRERQLLEIYKQQQEQLKKLKVQQQREVVLQQQLRQSLLEAEGG